MHWGQAGTGAIKPRHWSLPEDLAANEGKRLAETLITLEQREVTRSRGHSPSWKGQNRWRWLWCRYCRPCHLSTCDFGNECVRERVFRFMSTYILICTCYVCVCVRERERERELKEKKSIIFAFRWDINNNNNILFISLAPKTLFQRTHAIDMITKYNAARRFPEFSLVTTSAFCLCLSANSFQAFIFPTRTTLHFKGFMFDVITPPLSLVHISK